MSLHVIPPLVAVTSQMSNNEISPSELAQVAGALQKQVTRDLASGWKLPATVVSQPDPSKIPFGYWPIVIVGEIDEPGALGYHSDEHNQPFAVVQYDGDWSITASHELLEMLGDPFGSRFVVGKSLIPHQNQGRVQYLLELCDPCERFVYTVDGVRVSDFLLPHYHDPFTMRNRAYSFTGSLARARDVPQGGYLSWYAPRTGEWWQRTWFTGDRPVDRSLGRSNELRRLGETPREMIDRLTGPSNQFAEFSYTEVT